MNYYSSNSRNQLFLFFIMWNKDFVAFFFLTHASDVILQKHFINLHLLTFKFSKPTLWFSLFPSDVHGQSRSVYVESRSEQSSCSSGK